MGWLTIITPKDSRTYRDAIDVGYTPSPVTVHLWTTMPQDGIERYHIRTEDNLHIASTTRGEWLGSSDEQFPFIEFFSDMFPSPGEEPKEKEVLLLEYE